MTIQQLIEKYEEKANVLDEILSNDTTITGSQLTRFVGNRSTYREFAYELGKLMPEDSSDWLPIKDNLAKYNYEASKNCKVMFDNGETLRHFQEWPIAEATHFLPVSKEQNHQP